ncbi:hypothetical protein Tco_0723604, partial [Tanacetum coccineum]
GKSGVDEKSGVVPSIKVVKDTVMVSSSVMEEPVDAIVNTKDVNVGKTPTSPNVNPKSVLLSGKSGVDEKSGVVPSIKVVKDTVMVSSSVMEEPVDATVNTEDVINFRTLFTPRGNEVDVVVLVESIRATSAQFANTIYGFFLGKRVAYPVVANYVRNTWGKYGLVKSILHSSIGIFSFQISSMVGLDTMLENGPWFIRNNPIILKKWDPDVKCHTPT